MAIEKIKILGAEDLPYVKFIAIYALTFFGYIISVLVSVQGMFSPHIKKNDLFLSLGFCSCYYRNN